VRYCKDEGMVYVSKDHLAAWCAHRKLHVNDLICQLGNAGILKEVIGGVGTNRWLNLRKLTHGTPSDSGGRVRSFAVFYDKMVQSLGEEVDIQPAPPPRNVVALSITR